MAKTTINGTILRPDDTPETGYILFRLAETAALDGIEYSRVPIRINLDVNGEFTVQLHPNDDAGWSVEGNSYLVEERFGGKAPRRFYMVVPTSVPALDYADLATYGNAPTITANIDLAAEFAAFEAAANSTYVAQSRVPHNVKDYGAAGDGSTNDTAAIANAYAAAASSGRGLLFPAGGTYLTDPLTISANGVVVTAHGATIKARAASASGLLIVTGNDFVLNGGVIDGGAVIDETTGATSVQGLATHGVKIGNGDGSAGSRASLNGCIITHVKQHGLWVSDAPNVRVTDVRMRYNGTSTGTNGAGVYGSGANLTFRGCSADGNYEHGFYILAGTRLGTVLTGCHAVNNGNRSTGGVGFSIRASGATVTGCYSYNNHTGAAELAIPVQPSTPGLCSVFTGNNFGWSSEVATACDREVYISGIDQVVLTGNMFVSTGAGYALRVGASGLGGAETLISGNRITQNSASAGVLVERENCSFLGNVITGAAAGSAISIAAGVDGTTIVANVLRNFTNGVVLAAGTSDYTLVANNHFQSITSQDISNSATGTDLFVSRATIYGTAAPTTGLWRTGVICWNTAPAAGGTPGWVCTSSGTPGTWKAMANLAA